MGHLSRGRRLNTCTLIIGRKGTGKSTKACQMAQEYVRRNADKKKRALIVDVNGAPAYNALPFFSLRQVAAWKPDAPTRIAKSYLSKADDEDDKALFQGLKNFRSGLLVFEDCTKYIPGNPGPHVRKFLVDHRMWDVDLVFTFHSLVRVPPFFWEMTSHVVLCKTQDSRDKLSKRDAIPNLPDMLSAYDRVTRCADPFHAELVRTLI